MTTAPETPTPPADPVATRPQLPPVKSIIDLAIMNDSSSGLSDQEVSLYAEAVQRQIAYNFYPVWGIAAAVTFVPAGQKAPKGAWWLVVLGELNEAGALGYHDLTPQGNPCGYVGAKDDQRYGANIGVTISHEALEMLLDPWINDTRTTQDQNGNPIFWATEACDAVEDDSFAYDVEVRTAPQTSKLVKVSDFVCPDFFNPARFGQPDAVYDWKRVLHAPFQVARGGYLSKYVPGQGWLRLAEQGVKEIPDPDDPVDRAWGRGSRPTRRLGGRIAGDLRFSTVDR